MYQSGQSRRGAGRARQAGQGAVLGSRTERAAVGAATSVWRVAHSWARRSAPARRAAVRAGRAHPQGGKLIALLGPPLQPDPTRPARRRSSRVSGRGCTSTTRRTPVTSAPRHLGVSAVTVPVAHADALGLALAATPWTLTHGYLGSDARLLGAALPFRLGLDACDAAAAGFRSAGHPRAPEGFPRRLLVGAAPPRDHLRPGRDGTPRRCRSRCTLRVPARTRRSTAPSGCTRNTARSFPTTSPRWSSRCRATRCWSTRPRRRTAPVPRRRRRPCSRPRTTPWRPRSSAAGCHPKITPRPPWRIPAGGSSRRRCGWSTTAR
jgi:hypothetical protein